MRVELVTGMWTDVGRLGVAGVGADIVAGVRVAVEIALLFCRCWRCVR